jgi:hypothetical protein
MSLSPDPDLNHARVCKEKRGIGIRNGCRGRNVSVAVLFDKVVDESVPDARDGPLERGVGGHRAAAG